MLPPPLGQDCKGCIRIKSLTQRKKEGGSAGSPPKECGDTFGLNLYVELRSFCHEKVRKGEIIRI